MTNTLAAWLLTWVALSISISALFVGLRSLALYRSSRHSALSTRLQEVEETTDTLAASIRGLKARIGMAEVRAKRRGESDPEPDQIDPTAAQGAEFRRKMNAAIAAGQVSALPRR